MLKSIFYYLPEALAIVLVIHGLLQKKLRFDKLTILYLVINNIWYTFCNEIVPYDERYIGNLFVIVTILYVHYRFETGWEKSLQITMSNIFILFFVEMILWIVSYSVISILRSKGEIYMAISMCFMSMLTTFVTYLIYKKCNFTIIFRIVFEKNRILGRVIVIGTSIFLIYLEVAKTRGYCNGTEFIILSGFIVLLMLLLFQWKKVMELGQEKDKRILIQQMCQESYEQLILEVRNRQHEFQNHLTALQGMSYSCETIEELSRLQGQYCDEIMEKNKYNKLLYACKSPIIGGFLYSKFSKAEEKGIETDYQVSGNLETDKIEVFELIEILGILYDIAIDALKQEKVKKIYVGLKKEEEQLVISVENISPYISSNEIEAFFRQGFSTKGKERGLGLTKLQKMVEKNKGKIITQNLEKEGENWLSFTIYISPETYIH